MNIEDYLILTKGKQKRHCIVTTTALEYEGIFLCDKCPQNELLMKLRITNDFKKILANIADVAGNLPTKDDIIGIPIELIKKIEFDDECNS